MSNRSGVVTIESTDIEGGRVTEGDSADDEDQVGATECYGLVHYNQGCVGCMNFWDDSFKNQIDDPFKNQVAKYFSDRMVASNKQSVLLDRTSRWLS